MTLVSNSCTNRRLPSVHWSILDSGTRVFIGTMHDAED